MIALLCAAALALGACGPGSVIYGKSPDIDLSSKNAAPSGSGWRYDEAADTFYIENGASVRITNRTTTSRIVIEEGASAALTLQDAFIDLSWLEFASPILLEPDASLELKIEGENTFIAGVNVAGIQVPLGTALIVTSAAGDGEISGVLNVSATGYGAGIGGGAPYGNYGTIMIKGGTINAAGGEDAAGIGSSGNTSNGTITISNCVVNAEGGLHGAGIGGGWYGSGGTIRITDAVVNAVGTGSAAAIGGGHSGKGGDITITGGSGRAEAIWYPGWGFEYAIGPGRYYYQDHPGGSAGTFNGVADVWPEHTLVTEPAPMRLVYEW
ncbi:MAG: hypothetical protein MdMp014T_2862 [Treponematales bacterium]